MENELQNKGWWDEMFQTIKNKPRKTWRCHWASSSQLFSLDIMDLNLKHVKFVNKKN